MLPYNWFESDRLKRELINLQLLFLTCRTSTYSLLKLSYNYILVTYRKHTSLYGYWIDTRKTRIHSSYAKLSRGVRVKDPTTDLIFLRKNFLKPLSRVFFANWCRRLKPVLAWIGPKSITYFCKYSNLCEWEALFTISALQR